ncbi:hypothetical protein LOTGIDRAFT_206663 [Lottia gigantea]|uniref:Protein HIRA n=1 Tax=Lottia gigantea TaxID=225164 RepID=V4AE54_LOTGI|nr:hypothetical protein LOTGIDRAFT_206663 [Lottia gigantea]ESO91621.1 hypothetical protein LOTGIDRAFT_206663 [Lottia gigantea]
MRLLKPSWVEHDGQPIFSIDIHPDGSRFATGGQGDDCGKVVIWNMAPVRDEKAEKNESVPKVLCQMDNHLACVNCVRWSYNGKFLASGGDDKLVMIWQTSRYSGPSSTFGSSNKVVNIEQWRPVFTLRGHSGDVLDLSWSPHDAWLASCSVDNTVVIWNTNKFPEQVAVLKGHSGLVKGVTWDPVGKYLASQSDDKTLRVWRTRDWQTESIIREPFRECGGTTHVLRLDWSPDGHYIVSAHAMNNSGPTAQIIEREGWKVTLDFVGHRKAITVVRFNPNIFEKRIKKDSDKSQQYSCCAIGSKDRSISIWLTALKRPLVVTHDLFESSIMDISWSKSGFELMCCSIDGTVAYIDFSVEEIGTSLTQQEVQTVLEKIYGKGLPLRSMTTGNQIIESAAMLNLQQQAQKESQEKQQNSQTVSPQTPKTPQKHPLANGDVPFKPLDKQIETRTPDGRRRITPIFLAPQPDFGEAPLPFPGNVITTDSNISFATSKDPSKIQVEKLDRVTVPGLVSPSSKSTTSPQTGSNLSEPKPSPLLDKKASGDKKSEAAVFQPMTALEKTPEKSEKPKVTTSTPVEKRVDKEKLKDKPVGLSLKRKKGDDKLSKAGRSKKDRKDSDKQVTSLSASIAGPSFRTFSPPSNELSLPVQTIEKTSTLQISGKAGEENSISLEVENNVQCGLVTVHKLRLVKDSETSWEQILTSPINNMAASRCVACVSCEDSSVSIFSFGGRRLFPSLVLNSKISYLHCSSYFVMAITQKGSLHVWNMQNKMATINNENIASIINGNIEVDTVKITSEGLPVITLSNSKSYSYHTDLKSWVLIHENINNVIQCSDYQYCKLSSQITGPLISLQKSHNRAGMLASRTSSSATSVQQTATVSHLENQVAVCLGLKSQDEYKFWFLSYVRYLVQEGFEVKLREVCDDLLGPVIKNKSTSWNAHILGLDKHELLKEILPIIGSNLRWQRLYTEYQEQLDSL